MNRRRMAGSIPALLFSSATIPALAQSDTHKAILAQLIEQVIADGNMDSLDQLVAPDVTIAVLGVTNIDEFRDVSVDGHVSRSDQYEETSFDIESVVDDGEWCHALVRFEGRKASGGMEARSVFYVARFQDGLIQSFYLG